MRQAEQLLLLRLSWIKHGAHSSVFLLTMRRLPSGRLRRNASKFFTCQPVHSQLSSWQT